MVFMSLLSNAHTHMYTFSLDRQLLLLCFRRHTYEFLTNEQTHNAHRHRKKNALLGQDGFADWTWCSRIEYIRGMVLACTTTTHRAYNNESSTTTTQMLSLSSATHTHTPHTLSVYLHQADFTHKSTIPTHVLVQKTWLHVVATASKPSNSCLQ